MKSNLISYIIYSFFIKKILLSSDYNLGKYEMLPNYQFDYLIFDSSDFKIGEEIYFKITGRFQHSLSYIEYKFFDNPDEIEIDGNKNLIIDGFELYREFSNKIDRIYDDYGNVLYEIKYFTIDKKSEQLGGLKGDFLLIITYMIGGYDFENTKVNQGYSRIVGIIIACVVIVAIIVVIIIYCIRRKQMIGALFQANGNVNKMNNNIYGPPNFGGQQQVPIQNKNGPYNGYP